jgi:hypothetical protein
VRGLQRRYGASGGTGQLKTSKARSFTYTVTTTSKDGQTGTASITYTVVGTPPVPVTSVPVLTHVRQSAATWRESKSKQKHGPPVGTTFYFTLNEPATVTFRFTQTTTGRKTGGRCAAQTNKSRTKPRCTLTTVAGTLSRAGHPGANSLPFAGRVSQTNVLKPGSYTVQITATNFRRREISATHAALHHHRIAHPPTKTGLGQSGSDGEIGDVSKLLRRRTQFANRIVAYKVPRYAPGQRHQATLSEWRQTLSVGFRAFHDATPRRLRQVRWKEWKRVRTKLRMLRAAGIPEHDARGWAFSRKGYWRIAGSPVLSTALPNAYWANLGLQGFLDPYPRLREC